MKLQNREIIVASTIAFAAIVSHIAITRLLGFGLALPIIAGILSTWTLRRPLVYLLIIGSTAELLTTLPPLIMLSTTLIPWVVWRLRGRIYTDLSFSFVSLIGLTVLLQLTTVLARDVILFGQLPVGHTAAAWLTLSTLATGLSIAIADFIPAPQQSVISLEGYKLDHT